MQGPLQGVTAYQQDVTETGCQAHKSQLRLTALADQRNGVPEALPQDLVIRGQLQARLERMGLSAAAGPGKVERLRKGALQWHIVRQ